MKKIIEFQESQGLVPDGIIGIKTLLKMKAVFLIFTDIQLANFMGQLHHETSGFTKDTESFNYSVQGLKNTFSFYRRFPNLAWEHGRTWIKKADQEAIANNVYYDGNRDRKYKLGNTSWGDGWKFRGRGAIMVTGKTNYIEFGKYLGVFLVNFPEDVATKYYWKSALWYFDTRKLWGIANSINVKSITELTKRINGGLNGLEDRIKWTKHYYQILQSQLDEYPI